MPNEYVLTPEEYREYQQLKADAETNRDILGKLNNYTRVDDLFNDVALDMAKLLVKEAYVAGKSADRQKAINSLMDRGLGKAIERVMTISMKVSGSTDQELIREIYDIIRIPELRKELEGLGLTIQEGSSTSLLADEESGFRPDTPEEIQSKSRLSRRLLQE